MKLPTQEISPGNKFIYSLSIFVAGALISYFCGTFFFGVTDIFIYGSYECQFEHNDFLFALSYVYFGCLVHILALGTVLGGGILAVALTRLQQKISRRAFWSIALMGGLLLVSVSGAIQFFVSLLGMPSLEQDRSLCDFVMKPYLSYPIPFFVCCAVAGLLTGAVLGLFFRERTKTATQG